MEHLRLIQTYPDARELKRAFLQRSKDSHKKKALFRQKEMSRASI
jgi:hypothetical protein